MFWLLFSLSLSLITVRGVQTTKCTLESLTDDIRIDQCYFHKIPNAINVQFSRMKNIDLIASSFAETTSKDRAVYIRGLFTIECRVNCFYKSCEDQGALSVHLIDAAGTNSNIDMNTFSKCINQRHTIWCSGMTSRQNNLIQNNNISQSRILGTVGVIHAEKGFFKSTKNTIVNSY